MIESDFICVGAAVVLLLCGIIACYWMRHCKNCKKRLRNDAQYCFRCGHQQQAPKSQAPLEDRSVCGGMHE